MIIGFTMTCKGQFTSSNYIPDNILIPNNCLKHHQFYFYINNIKELLSIIDNLEIKIDIEYVDLYSELDKKIHSSILEQEFCLNNKYNSLRIASGMDGLVYDKYLSKEQYENIKYNNKKNINVEPQDDLLLENVGKKISIYGFDGCIVQYGKNLLKFDINDFFKFNDKINFVCYDKTYKITNKLSYHKIILGDVFIHNYLIDFDTNDILLPNMISKLEFGSVKINTQDIIEFTFKYKCIVTGIGFQEGDEFTFDENININDITRNNIKINLNNFVPFRTSSTNIILTIKTNTPDEPIGDELLVITREHISNSNQLNTINNN